MYREVMFRLQSRYEFSFEESDAIEVDIDASGLSTTVVPVAFRRSKTFFSMQGSAFCIAGFESGEVVFATAKHVIEELVNNPEVEAFVLLPAGLATKEERRSLTGVRVHEIALAEAY